MKKKSRLTGDLGLKVLSIILACALWKFVHNEQKQQRSLDVELELVNIPNNLVLGRDVDTQVKVRVIGAKSRVEAMNQEYLGTHTIDLSKSSVGMNTHWIQEDDFNLPYGVRIDRIVPQIIRVDLDRSVRKRLQVLPKFNDKLEEGFEIESYSIVPDRMDVSGPKTTMDLLDKLYTTSVDLKTLRSYYEQEVPIDTSSFKVSLKQDTVLLRIKVKENQIKKVVRRVELIYNKERYKVLKKYVDLEVEGLAGDMLAFDKANLKVSLDSSFSTSFTNSIRVRPVVTGLPQNVSVKIFPETVRMQKIK